MDLIGITHGERPDNSAISNLYSILSNLASLVVQKQQEGDIAAGLIEGEAQRAAKVYIGTYVANVVRPANPALAGSRIGVMFLRTGPDEFLVVSSGDATLSFSSDKPGPPSTGVISIEEEFFEQGTWRSRRRLNGDETSHGQALKLYQTDLSQGRIYRVRLYRYR